MKKYEIWSSEIELNDWKNFISNFEEEEKRILSGEEAYELCCEMNAAYLDDERMNFDRELNGEILVIADLGLWNGRRSAYRFLGSRNIKDIFKPFTDCSFIRWYTDGEDVCCDEIHHDGTNHYIYREVKNPDNIWRLTDQIYSGKPFSRDFLDDYTRSLAPYVEEIYG